MRAAAGQMESGDECARICETWAGRRDHAGGQLGAGGRLRRSAAVRRRLQRHGRLSLCPPRRRHRARPSPARRAVSVARLRSGFSDGAGTTGLNQAQNEKLADRGFIEGGIGCQLSDTFRVDVTGGYLFKASLHDPYPNSLSANLETYTGFVNMYYDITNYGGFTPYVGGGVGVAYHELTNLTFPAGARDGSNYDFAWHVTAGMSYDLSDSLKLDVAYRYMDLGEARSNSDLGHVSGAGPIAVRDLHDHQIKVGLRYHFGW